MGPDNAEALFVTVLPATYPVAAMPGRPSRKKRGAFFGACTQADDLLGDNSTRSGSTLGEELVQLNEPLTLFKVGDHLREQGLKPPDKCRVGAVADPDPDNGRYRWRGK